MSVKGVLISMMKPQTPATEQISTAILEKAIAFGNTG
jgi:hypothetical protein